jgi:hypothetical protein
MGLSFQASDAQMCATYRFCYDTHAVRVKLQYFTFVHNNEHIKQTFSATDD